MTSAFGKARSKSVPAQRKAQVHARARAGSTPAATQRRNAPVALPVPLPAQQQNQPVVLPPLPRVRSGSAPQVRRRKTRQHGPIPPPIQQHGAPPSPASDQPVVLVGDNNEVITLTPIQNQVRLPGLPSRKRGIRVAGQLQLTFPEPSLKEMNDALATAVVAYRDRTVPASEKLRLIKRALHLYMRWFDAQHVTGWHKLSDEQRAVEREIRTGLAELERMHIRLIDKASSAEQDAPMVFAPTVTPAMQKVARKLWLKLARNRSLLHPSFLRIEGSREHSELMLSYLVRLLETPTGIRLIHRLMSLRKPVLIAAHVPRRLRSCVLFSEKTEPFAHQQFAEPSQVPPAAAVSNLAMSQRRVVLLTQPTEGHRYRRVRSLIEITEAVLDGDVKVHGFVVDIKGVDHYFAFAPGAVGGVVTMSEESDEATAANGDAIFMPGWITLGHELTHMLHLLTGAVTEHVADLLERFVDAGGESPDTFFGNAEEAVVILGIENLLRWEAGLRLRGRHTAVVDNDLWNRRLQVQSALIRLKTALENAKGKTGADVKRVQRQLDAMNAAIRLGHAAELRWCTENEQLIADLMDKWNLDLGTEE